MSSLNIFWVFDCTPRKLRERPAVTEDALCLHLEATLLRHGCIKATKMVRKKRHIRTVHHEDETGVKDIHIVSGAERGIKRDVAQGGELVLGGVVRSHVHNRVDVGLKAKEMTFNK